MQTNLQNPNLPRANSTNKRPVAEQKTFLEHAYEVRSRLFWIVLSIIGGAALGFQYSDHLIAAVMAPLHGQKLVYLTPGGGFSFIFTLSVYFGMLVAIPIIVYHFYRFLQPLLKQTSRRMVVLFMFLSAILAVGGVAFGYFVTIPAALDFLAAFAGDAVTPNLTADSYLSFVVAYMLGLALIFQLPLIVFLIDYVRPFPPGALSSSQRFVIIGATVLAALITPTPDAFNMMIVAAPIVVVYQLGVVAVYFRHRHLIKASQRRHGQKATSKNAQPLTAMLEDEDFLDFEAPGQTQNTRMGTGRPQQKVIDGIVRPQQRVQGRLAVPPRAEHVARGVQGTQPLRSIDGFAIRRLDQA